MLNAADHSEAATLAPAPRLPLCVDLDGTLVRSDTLIELALTLAMSWRLWREMLLFPVRGRAAFKARIAQQAVFDPALLPYNEHLLSYLRAEKRAGRRLVLVTAADTTIASAVASHLGLFDEIMASDGTRNLKGIRKAEALCAAFGKRGFVYAGNEAIDLHVWREAAAAILVQTSGRVTAAARAQGPVEAQFQTESGFFLPLLHAMRPYQWVKNLLVFVPIFTAHAWHETAAWIGACLVFAAFCATASSVYIVNDLTDLAADRRHPRKRQRPFASGALHPLAGLAVAALLAGTGAGLAIASGTLFVIAVYVAMTLSYSLILKEMPLVDVFLLAALYSIRLFGGGTATGHTVSLWLLGFSSFLFLGLALLKRVEELTSMATAENRFAVRRGYMPSDASILQIFGCGAAFASSVVLALFVQNEATTARYALPGLLWALVPLMLFWQCRLWLSTARGYMHDDPIIYAAGDWVSWIVGAVMLALLVAAKTNPFGLF